MCFVPILGSQRGLSEPLPVDMEIDRQVYFMAQPAPQKLSWCRLRLTLELGLRVRQMLSSGRAL